MSKLALLKFSTFIYNSSSEPVSHNPFGVKRSIHKCLLRPPENTDISITQFITVAKLNL